MKLDKYLDIQIVLKGDADEDYLDNLPWFMKRLAVDECNFIDKHIEGIDVTEENFRNALGVILRHMRITGDMAYNLNIGKFNRSFAPPERLTKDEIETRLGYKIEIVDD